MKKLLFSVVFVFAANCSFAQTYLMSYSHPNCWSYFSLGQGQRMRNAIAILPHLSNSVVGCGTSSNLTITQNVSSGNTETQRASISITVCNVIENGATAIYKAGQSITLRPGFHAKSGSTFTASIESCEQSQTSSKRKEKNKEMNQDSTVIGKWTLINITGGLSPEENYDSGAILWEFNSTHQLSVKINIDLPPGRVPLRNNGVYNFEFTRDKISIEDTEYEYLLDNNKLILSDGVASDGPRLEFVKIAKETNISFFDNSTFILQHFLVNGEQQDLVLIHPNGRDTRRRPHMMFTFNKETTQLEASIGGYCNSTSAKYNDRGTYLEVMERGATTLADCGVGESTDYFDPITGYIYLRQPPEKIFYEITQDRTGLWLWANENHKLYFTKGTLSIEEEKLQNSIKIYPNPANNYIEIQANSIQISEISIIDIQGKVVLMKTSKFKKIDVSNFTSGMYFIKIKTKEATITKKIIIEVSR